MFCGRTNTRSGRMRRISTFRWAKRTQGFCAGFYIELTEFNAAERDVAVFPLNTDKAAPDGSVITVSAAVDVTKD